MGYITLTEIIEKYLDREKQNLGYEDNSQESDYLMKESDRAIDMEDGIICNIRNKFRTFLKSIGADENALKDGGRNYLFEEKDVPIVIALISVLQSSEKIKEYWKDYRDKDGLIHYHVIHEYISDLASEIESTGHFSRDVIDVISSKIFDCYNAYPNAYFELCHDLIEEYRQSLVGFLCGENMSFVYRLHCILVGELTLLDTEVALRAENICNCRKQALECFGKVDYSYSPGGLGREYAERDRNLLRKIRDDNDLRVYLEKKIGYTIEEVFGSDDN